MVSAFAEAFECLRWTRRIGEIGSSIGDRRDARSDRPLPVHFLGGCSKGCMAILGLRAPNRCPTCLLDVPLLVRIPCLALRLRARAAPPVRSVFLRGRMAVPGHRADLA